MSQITQDFAERMVRTADAEKFSSLTQWEQKQLALAWLALHGHLAWPGMPSVRDTLKEARAYVAGYAQAPGCATAANDLLLQIDNVLNAAPREGVVPPADPATNGEHAAAAPLPEEKASIPVGFKVVPRHPTQAMLDAGNFANGLWDEKRNSVSRPLFVWRAMLAALPSEEGWPVSPLAPTK